MTSNILWLVVWCGIAVTAARYGLALAAHLN